MPRIGDGLRERICRSASSCCLSSACCSASRRSTASCFSSCCCCRLCRSLICCSRLAQGVTFGAAAAAGRDVRWPFLPLLWELLLAAVLRPAKVAPGLPLRSCGCLQSAVLLLPPGAACAADVEPSVPAVAGGGAKSTGYLVALPASPSSDSRVLSAAAERPNCQYLLPYNQYDGVAAKPVISRIFTSSWLWPPCNMSARCLLHAKKSQPSSCSGTHLMSAASSSPAG